MYPYMQPVQSTGEEYSAGYGSYDYCDGYSDRPADHYGHLVEVHGFNSTNNRAAIERKPRLSQIRAIAQNTLPAVYSTAASLQTSPFAPNQFIPQPPPLAPGQPNSVSLAHYHYSNY
ncbi:hypothetical protein DL89DRAFT_269993 [Linderina pennispora]|uniref:Uncharacterized protein n=1 Tax=Linderina pennispora TaxID=61395 RepID=A0A1Y1VZI7_9FUNG|nr:uncharacterized protein DL89DRAFT_269993 [Linderina pennispora]ORX66435.1 hypothetical protein DL89DRAFT_269993 [Linderina pennispora]